MIGIQIGKYGIRFFYQKKLRAADVITQPHPGFMTDWQPLWAVLVTQAEGSSIIHETIYPTRFHYINHLQQMGVKATLFNPSVNQPDKFYNFDIKNDKEENLHAVKIKGPTTLKPGKFEVKDLRHGATLVIASIISPGVSTITNIEQIDRGYENLDLRLQSMGAKIQRVS